MYSVAIIPMPSAADLQAMLNDEAHQDNTLVSMAVDQNQNELILIFESSDE